MTILRLVPLALAFLAREPELHVHLAQANNSSSWAYTGQERYALIAYRTPTTGGPQKWDVVWTEWAFGIYGGERWDRKSRTR